MYPSGVALCSIVMISYYILSFMDGFVIVQINEIFCCFIIFFKKLRGYYLFIPVRTPYITTTIPIAPMARMAAEGDFWVLVG